MTAFRMDLHGRRAGALAILALALSVSAVSAQVVQQGAPRTLELRTTSPAAKAAFREALFEAENVGGPLRIQAAIAKSVAADGGFTLARVYQTLNGPGTGPERAQAITAMLPSLASAPAVELLLATAWREQAAGRNAAYGQILHSVAELVPEDSQLVWAYWLTQRGAKSPKDRVATEREMTQRFPGLATARNQLGYDLQAIGDEEGARTQLTEYLRLAPNYPNGFDTYAEVLLLQGRGKEALAQARASIAADSTFQGGGGYARLGIIQLTTGDAAGARASFARRVASVPTDASRLASAQWTAVTYIHSGDGPAAMRELANVIATAQAQGNTAAVLSAHERMAAVEAYLGNLTAAPGHLHASEPATPTAGHAALKAIVFARTGDAAQTRAAVDQFKSLIPPTNAAAHTYNALVAIQANDVATAARELADAPPEDLFTNALRADVLAKQGKGAEAAALRQKIVASPVNAIGNTNVDFFRVLARLEAQKAR